MKTDLYWTMNELSIQTALLMDETWSAFDKISTDRTEFIKQFVPEIYLRPEVHLDTKENFRIIRKLLEHSYFEYKFYDIAALKTMLTMEMALKLRYQEINSIKWNKKKSLEQLIDWFFERDYFEVYNPDYLKSLREIRNIMAHPYGHTYSGPSSSHLIENVIDLVNGLYEEPQLRKQRINSTVSIRSLLEGFNEEIKIIRQKKTYLAHRAWPGFLNNKGGKRNLHFYYKPMYEIQKEYLTTNQWALSPTEYFNATTYTIAKDYLILENDNGEELLVEAIKDQNELQGLRKWRKEYKEFAIPTGDHFFTHTQITGTFLKHLREFHKI